MTNAEIIKACDCWYDRLTSGRALTSRESVQLQGFLAAVKNTALDAFLPPTPFTTQEDKIVRL